MSRRLNIELFKKVRDRIAETPESYDQRHFMRDNNKAPCGTAACIAGETIICSAATIKQGIKKLSLLDAGGDTPQKAMELLGLAPKGTNYFMLGYDDGAKRLFYEYPDQHEYGWPEPFRTDWAKSPTGERWKVAVAFLDHIIETGKVLE